MRSGRNWAATAMLGIALGAVAAPAGAEPDGQPQAGMLVVYGVGALSREGDPDWREQIFFSVPADLEERLYVRVFDPEVSGRDDFVLGGSGDSETTFRVFGGKGAFSDADRPEPVRNGERGAGATVETTGAVAGPGNLIREKAWGNDPATDGRWVNLAALSARLGEEIDGRAWFRLDIQGSSGNDGNAYSVGVSLARDRDRPPEGLDMFSYRPTVRWDAGNPPTQVRFVRRTAGPLVVQSFDAAGGQLALVTDFRDLGVRVSGQDHWTSDVIETDETNLALNLLNGFEIPNDVTLAVFDGAGDPVPLQMPPVRAPVPPRPVARAAGEPLADCRSVAFDASGSTGRTPLSFLWEFGDGGNSDQPVIVHRYAQPGRYTARLSVMEPGDRPGRGDRVELPVHVRDAPVAAPGNDITVAPGEAVAFDGSVSRASDSPIARYHWQFGDGTSAEGPKASHVYDGPGRFRAILRVEDDSGNPCDFGVGVRQVIVNAAPVAEAGTDRIARTGQTLRFDGSASYDVDGEIASYRWDMGDGTVLDGRDVAHSYAASGDYVVTLTVTDDSGVANDAAIDRARVVVNAPPEPRFAPPPRALSVSEAAVLDGSGSVDPDGRILRWEWNFGDGTTAEGSNVRYAWSRPGTYTVTLTVTDDSGTGSARQSVSTQVRVDAAPVAEAGPDRFVTASEVEFDGGGSTDSDGRVTEWNWDFGDGSTGSGRVVTHAYASPGMYEVALLVRDDSGTPHNSSRDTMRVRVNASPIADAGPPLVVAPGEEFTVSGRASVDPDGRIAEYLWDFPDGTRAAGQRVRHRFDKPGLYRVRLTVRDDFPEQPGEDETEVLITVNAPPVAVAGTDRRIAPGDTVVFDAGNSFDSDGKITSFRWEFDDLGAPLDAARVERAYVTPGVWSAQLIVTDDSGVANSTGMDDVTIRVNHAPVAEAGEPIDTESLFVEFDGSGSGDADGDNLIYLWDFGDGTPPAQGARVTHAYARPGVFPVRLEVDDGTGLANATAVDATTVHVRARPVAVAGGNRDVCSGEPILFDASDSLDPDGGLLRYSWDFGDGTGSELINPSKTYERPGTYPVTLTVRNETGTRYGTALDRIAALVREGPIADAGGDRTVCSNQKVRFDGSGSTDSDGAVNLFSWTFGDGGTGSGATPSYTFRRPGTYQVTLTITGDAQGACSPLDSDVATVTVIAAPELAVDGPDRVAAGAQTRFAAALSQLGGATPSSIAWDFGDGTTADGAEVNHAFAAPGAYLVTLRVDLTGGTEGCTSLETVRKVVVNAAPEPVIEAPSVVAIGDAVTFDAGMSSDPDGAITAFVWDFGDGETARSVLPTHRFEKPGEFDVRLTVEDDAGVDNSTASAVHRVKVVPAPAVAVAEPGAICPGEPSEWSVRLPQGATASWQFGEGAEAEGASATHTFARPGVFPVRVTVENGVDRANASARRELYARVNAAPTALAGPDRVVCPGETVAFDAGASADPDGRILSWEWNFSDGVVLTGRKVERSFDAAGPVQLRLIVRDDSGAGMCDAGTDTARILVNSAPVVDAGLDRTVKVGAAHDVLRFDAGGATDPDGQGLRIDWDFGDGTVSAGAVANHGYSVPGEYTVTVRARDTSELACGVATDTAVVTAVPRD